MKENGDDYLRIQINSCKMLQISDKISMDGKPAEVLAVNHSTKTFYYIQTKEGGDWYCEDDLEIKEEQTNGK